jgi:hypothetical protein
MVVDGDSVVLRGDTTKALSVLTYLCSSQRTPEIDWMLDVVTVFGQDQPLQWKDAWKRKLRHTKRGVRWRSRRELREQKKATQISKERRQHLGRDAVERTIDVNWNPDSRITSPTLDKIELGDRTDLNRFFKQTNAHPWVSSGVPERDDHDD